MNSLPSRPASSRWKTVFARTKRLTPNSPPSFLSPLALQPAMKRLLPLKVTSHDPALPVPRTLLPAREICPLLPELVKVNAFPRYYTSLFANDAHRRRPRVTLLFSFLDKYTRISWQHLIHSFQPLPNPPFPPLLSALISTGLLHCTTFNILGSIKPSRMESFDMLQLQASAYVVD